MPKIKGCFLQLSESDVTTKSYPANEPRASVFHGGSEVISVSRVAKGLYWSHMFLLSMHLIVPFKNNLYFTLG